MQSLRTENQVLKGKGREVDKGSDSVRPMDISDFEENEKVKFYTVQGETIINTSLALALAFFPSFLIILFASEKKLRKSKKH